jgi:hypothetical protein
MAGLGRKTFAQEEILRAADVNGYLMDQSVMRFADSAARGSAIGTAVAEGMVSYLDDANAVEVYDGSDWKSVGQDLTTGTSGFTALSAGTAGISYQPVSHNYIINGALDFWQRGTSFTASGTFSADRFYTTSVGAHSISQATDTASIANYSLEMSSTGGSVIRTRQPLEQDIVKPLRGQEMTFSVYAKQGAQYGATDASLSVRYSNSTDARASQGTAVASLSISPGATWQRFSLTFTVPADAVGLEAGVLSSSMVSGDSLLITGVQLEAGSVATPFKRHAPSLQGELAACQRYYYRLISNASAARFGNGYFNSTTEAQMFVSLPVPLRIPPTALEQSGTAADYSAITSGASIFTATSVPTHSRATDVMAQVNMAVSGATSGAPLIGRFVNTNAYLGWSAEL